MPPSICGWPTGPALADRLEFLTDRLDSPIGELAIMADRRGALRGLAWGDRLEIKRKVMDRHYGAGTYELLPAADPFGLTTALRRYFAGELRALEGVPVATLGSDFQRAVWAELRRIPVGETISYGEMARRVGDPGAARAVGLANNANPIGIVVPCHRVIGADGKLVGFGGGMARKQWLLSHESRAGRTPELPF